MEEVVLSREEQQQQTIDRIWEFLPPVWHQIRCNVRSAAAEAFGVSLEQFHVLRQIKKGLQSVSQLADEKGISRAAASQAVEGLVSRGLVQRTVSTEDRRYIQLEVTEQGGALLDEIYRQNRAWMREKLAVLQPDQLNQIDAALQLLGSVFVDSKC